jgi:hypothetical protein
MKNGGIAKRFVEETDGKLENNNNEQSLLPTK